MPHPPPPAPLCACPAACQVVRVVRRASLASISYHFIIISNVNVPATPLLPLATAPSPSLSGQLMMKALRKRERCAAGGGYFSLLQFVAWSNGNLSLEKRGRWGNCSTFHAISLPSQAFIINNPHSRRSIPLALPPVSLSFAAALAVWPFCAASVKDLQQPHTHTNTVTHTLWRTHTFNECP